MRNKQNVNDVVITGAPLKCSGCGAPKIVVFDSSSPCGRDLCKCSTNLVRTP